MVSMVVSFSVPLDRSVPRSFSPVRPFHLSVCVFFSAFPHRSISVLLVASVSYFAPPCVATLLVFLAILRTLILVALIFFFLPLRFFVLLGCVSLLFPGFPLRLSVSVALRDLSLVALAPPGICARSLHAPPIMLGRFVRCFPLLLCVDFGDLCVVLFSLGCYLPSASLGIAPQRALRSLILHRIYVLACR